MLRHFLGDVWVHVRHFHCLCRLRLNSGAKAKGEFDVRLASSRQEGKPVAVDKRLQTLDDILRGGPPLQRWKDVANEGLDPLIRRSTRKHGQQTLFKHEMWVATLQLEEVVANTLVQLVGIRDASGLQIRG